MPALGCFFYVNGCGQMSKKCPNCGFENSDDAKFCSSCGYAFDVSGGTQNSPPNQAINQRSRLLRALDLFLKNLAIIIPSIVLLAVEIILVVVSGVFFFAVFGFSSYPLTSIVLASILSHVFGLIISVILAVLYFITLHATMYGAREVIHNRNVSIDSTFKRALPTLHDLYVPMIIIVIVAALVGFVDSFLAFIVVGVLSVPVYIMSASIVLGKSKGFSESFNWFMELFNKDGSSALVILLGSLISLIPVINIFAIPYTAELTYISVDEVSTALSK